MKVGVFTYDFYPFEGGQGRHIYEIYNRLIDNTEIELLIFSPCRNKLKNHVSILPFTKKFGKNILFSILLHFCLGNIIRAHKIDIIHFHGGPGGLFFLREINIPVIYTVHHTYYQQYRFIHKQKWKWIFSLIESSSYKKADKIIAVSSSTKNVLVERYGLREERIKVIPNGVDLSRFHPMNIDKIPNSILYVGRLDKRKGIDFLVKTIPLIKKEIPEIKLFIVGKGKLRKPLEKFIHFHHLESNIQFLGFIPDRELPQWYNKAEITVIPSVFEGFGITAIESMACGTPVIATKVDGLKDVIDDGKTGFLIAPSNKEELSNTIIRILKNEKLRDKIIKNGKKEILDRFKWNKIIGEILGIYQTVIK